MFNMLIGFCGNVESNSFSRVNYCYCFRSFRYFFLKTESTEHHASSYKDIFKKRRKKSLDKYLSFYLRPDGSQNYHNQLVCQMSHRSYDIMD